MLEKLTTFIHKNSFTYNFVKIGLFSFAAIILFEAGKFVGGLLKLLMY